jgi:hypothetical protein
MHISKNGNRGMVPGEVYVVPLLSLSAKSFSQLYLNSGEVIDESIAYSHSQRVA